MFSHFQSLSYNKVILFFCDIRHKKNIDMGFRNQDNNKKKQIKTNHQLQIPINTTLKDLIEKKRKSIT